MRSRRSSTRQPVEFKLPIRNVHRTVGAMLSGEIARRWGSAGLAGRYDQVLLHMARRDRALERFWRTGVTLTLEGDANDYVGKGLSGGRIIVLPAEAVELRARGEHSGRQRGAVRRDFRRSVFNGVAGERFAVRNSGATAVVEGVGDHGCEYMTKGLVVVLGRTGKNFAAGMSGGFAYVLDETGEFVANAVQSDGRGSGAAVGFRHQAASQSDRAACGADR